jgi:hypothetical protein
MTLGLGGCGTYRMVGHIDLFPVRSLHWVSVAIIRISAKHLMAVGTGAIELCWKRVG